MGEKRGIKKNTTSVLQYILTDKFTCSKDGSINELSGG
jgi:hypothetical protein